MNYKPLLDYAPKVAQRLSEHGPYDTLWDRYPGMIASMCERIRSGDLKPSSGEVRKWMGMLQDIDHTLLPDLLRRRAEYDAEQRRLDAVRAEILSEHGERCENNACWEDFPECSLETLTLYKGEVLCPDCLDGAKEWERERSNEYEYQNHISYDDRG